MVRKLILTEEMLCLICKTLPVFMRSSLKTLTGWIVATTLLLPRLAMNSKLTQQAVVPNCVLRNRHR